MTEQFLFPNTDSQYKNAFVHFIKAQKWDWFVTIPIGQCLNDERVIETLRAIDARLSARYVSRRFADLPDAARYFMLVAFEGEHATGDRHAHILVRAPTPKRRCATREMAVTFFPQEFRFLWYQLYGRDLFWPQRIYPGEPWCESDHFIGVTEAIEFGRMNEARSIYPMKDIRLAEVPWSRFEFVRPPKSKKFKNENLSVIRNRNRQRRVRLGLH